ncbi:hypothetical protein BT69DRAFT_1340637 [Atractiella rhizophila]|nr:hypothetical protein BT69DRAFT_1340637 [Atractiella rhizophila]
MRNSQRAVDESDGGGRANSTYLVDKSGSNWESAPSHSIHATPSFPRVVDVLGIDEEIQNDPVQLLDFTFTEFRAMCRNNKLRNARGEFKTDQTVVDNISTLLKTCLSLLKVDPLSEMCHIFRNQLITNKSIELILDRLDGIESKLAEGIHVRERNDIRPAWVPDAKDFPPLSLLPSLLDIKNAPIHSKAASKKARQRRNRFKKLTLFPPPDWNAIMLINPKRICLLRDETPEEQDNSIVTASAVDKLPGGGLTLWFNDTVNCNRATETITEWLDACGELKRYIRNVPTDVVVIHRVPTDRNIKDENHVKKLLLERNNWTETDILKLEWVSKKVFKDKDVESSVLKSFSSLLIFFKDGKVADDAIERGVLFNGRRLNAEKLIRALPQCFNCFQLGHFGRNCHRKGRPVCGACAEDHDTKNYMKNLSCFMQEGTNPTPCGDNPPPLAGMPCSHIRVSLRCAYCGDKGHGAHGAYGGDNCLRKRADRAKARLVEKELGEFFEKEDDWNDEPEGAPRSPEGEHMEKENTPNREMESQTSELPVLSNNEVVE